MEAWEEVIEIIKESLADLLGTYTFEVEGENGQQTITKSAVAAVPPQLNSDRAVAGLEAIISKSPTFSQAPLSDRLMRRRSFTIYLIQHDKTKTTEAATSRLLQIYEDASHSLLPDTDDSEEQAAVIIPERLKSISYRKKG